MGAAPLGTVWSVLEAGLGKHALNPCVHHCLRDAEIPSSLSTPTEQNVHKPRRFQRPSSGALGWPASSISSAAKNVGCQPLTPGNADCKEGRADSHQAELLCCKTSLSARGSQQRMLPARRFPRKPGSPVSVGVPGMFPPTVGLACWGSAAQTHGACQGPPVSPLWLHTFRCF